MLAVDGGFEEVIDIKAAVPGSGAAAFFGWTFKVSG